MGESIIFDQMRLLTKTETNQNIQSNRNNKEGTTGGSPLSTGGLPVSTGGLPVSTGGLPVSTGGLPVSTGCVIYLYVRPESTHLES